MPKTKTCVITVHGVNTRGVWQRSVKRVLRPHFECVSIKYADYRDLRRTVSAGLALWALPFFILGLIATPILFIYLSPVWALTTALATLAITAAGIFHARLRRRRVIEKIKRKIERKRRTWHSLRPHLIAHSMGTFLTICALDVFPNLSLGRIVLVGSVLPRRFGWRPLKDRRSDAFDEVRNEVGEADLVVWLVGRIASILPDFGDSGRLGFLGDGRWVHQQKKPRGPCDNCRRRRKSPQALIHNLPLKEFEHSTAFLSADHCDQLWLPFFWGYEPEEFFRFREMCLTVVELEQAKDWLGTDDAIEELRNRGWTWTQRAGVRQSLEDFFADNLRRELRRSRRRCDDDTIAALTNKALRLVCRIINRARLERDRYPRWRENIASWYHPRIALGCAMHLVARAAR